MLKFGPTPVTGTATGDIIIVDSGSSGLVQSQGNIDIVIADFGLVLSSTGGTAIGNAAGLESNIDYWHTDATRENIFVGDDSIPNMMIALTTTIGSAAYFAVIVPAGETLTVDVDGAGAFYGNSSNLDTVIALLNASGATLSSADDGSSSAGGEGSISNRDGIAAWTNTTGGSVTVYIRIGQFGQVEYGFTEVTQFLVNVSLTGHSVSGVTPTGGAQQFDLDAGDDLASGGGGDDEFFDYSGNDRMFGGAGDDRFFNGAGADHMDGGAGFDAVYYEQSLGGVVLDLGAGTGVGAYAEGDTFVSIEALHGSSFNDTLTGGEAGDYLYGEDGEDALSGAGGNDVIDGGSDNDTVVGGAGNDVLWGGSGNDELRGGIGLDQVNGGIGNDLIYVESFSALDDVDGGAGLDTVQVIGAQPNGMIVNLVTGKWSLAGSPTTKNIKGIESFLDGDGATTVTSSTSAHDDGLGYWSNTLLMAGGNDTVILSNNTLTRTEVDMGTGDDKIVVLDVTLGDQDDMDGGDGTDTIDFSSIDLSQGGANTSVTISLISNAVFHSGGTDLMYGFENITGSRGSERIVGSAAANVLNGQAGNDVIEAGEGDDTLRGDSGNDELIGGVGADILVGGAGDDRLRGGEGDDRLDGGSGGFDLLEGGTGNDTYVIYDANDLIYEVAGEGTDTVSANYSYTLLSNFENLTLTGTAGLNGTGNALDNTIRGTALANTLIGLAGSDTLFGNDGADNLFGGMGDDTLRGGNQDDVLRGGSGADKLYGNAGIDRLFGEGDADIFFFANGETGSTAASADIIGDFVRADGDHISLAGIDANAALGGDQKFAFIGTVAFTGNAGELRYYTSGGQTVLEGDTDGDGLADMVIKLTGVFTMQSSDFFL